MHKKTISSSPYTRNFFCAKYSLCRGIYEYIPWVSINSATLSECILFCMTSNPLCLYFCSRQSLVWPRYNNEMGIMQPECRVMSVKYYFNSITLLADLHIHILCESVDTSLFFVFVCVFFCSLTSNSISFRLMLGRCEACVWVPCRRFILFDPMRIYIRYLHFFVSISFNNNNSNKQRQRSIEI